MTRRRFYAPPAAFAPDGAAVVLSAEESRHLRDVLRLRAGDEAFVFDGEGREFACAVEDAGGRGAREARLAVRGEAEPLRPESPLGLTLAAGLLKGEKFDLVVQKATELGAARIVPLVTSRAVVRLDETRGESRRARWSRIAAEAARQSRRADVRLRDARDTAARVARWRRLALEAAKQSGRARLPAIEPPAAFSEFIARAPQEGAARLLFAERGGQGLDETISAERATTAVVVALVGPEGGWDDAELDAARRHGWRLVTLGGRVLRAETAALAAAALLQHRLGDLK